MLTDLRSFDLPDDVFGEDEVKPSRPQKKKKRTATEVGPVYLIRPKTLVDIGITAFIYLLRPLLMLEGNSIGHKAPTSTNNTCRSWLKIGQFWFPPPF